MLIEDKKKESPEDFLDMRKWKEFLESVPVDGNRYPYFVRNVSDLPIIRVRASQLSTAEGATVQYKVSIDFERKAIFVTATKKKDA